MFGRDSGRVNTFGDGDPCSLPPRHRGVGARASRSCGFRRGAVLALLVVLVPYLLASPPIDDRALAAAIGTPHWLWPATLAIVAWVWVLAYSTWTMRLFHRQQGPSSATVGRKRRVSHG